MTEQHLVGAAAAILAVLLLLALAGSVAAFAVWQWASRYASVRLDKDESGRVEGSFVVRAVPPMPLRVFETAQPEGAE